jgi:hypothetical protein
MRRRFPIFLRLMSWSGLEVARSRGDHKGGTESSKKAGLSKGEIRVHTRSGAGTWDARGLNVSQAVRGFESRANKEISMFLR